MQRFSGDPDQAQQKGLVAQTLESSCFDWVLCRTAHSVVHRMQRLLCLV